MAEQLELSVSAREEFGKGPNRRLRNEGFAPGVFYNAKGENIPVKVEEIPLQKLYRKVGSSHVFTLKLEKDGKVEAMPCFIRELIRHPFKAETTHVDFYGIDMDKKVKVKLPVKTEGRAKGQVIGGVLNIIREELVVECLPADIPQSLVINISDLDAGQNFMVADVQTPEGVAVVYDKNFAVLGISAPKGKKAAGEEEAE